MQLTKQQRKTQGAEIRRAVIGAIIVQFTGGGSFSRVHGVIWRFTLTALLWSIGTASFVVTAIVTWMIFGTDHAQFLILTHGALGKGGYQEIHADGIAALVTALKLGAIVGVPAGIVTALLPITGPARGAVLAKWRKTDDGTATTA
jgi:ABC-type proline/glycine betaine transport system permease subunit